MSEAVVEAPIAALNETPADAPAAPATTTTDTYVPVFKKELRKKDQEHEDAEFANGKAFLSTKLSKDSVSVYDHLTSLVSRILETKPSNAIGMLDHF